MRQRATPSRRTTRGGECPDGSRRPQAPHVDGHVDGQVAGYDDGDAYGDAHGESQPDRYVDGIVDVDSSPFPVPQRGVRT